MNIAKRLFFISLIALAFIACSEKVEEKEDPSLNKAEEIKNNFSLKLSDNSLLNFSFESDDKLAFSDNSAKLFIFFTKLCLPCEAQIDVLNELKKDHPSLKIIGLLLEENMDENINSYIKNHKVNYPISVAKENFELALRLGGVSDVPSLVLIDKTGRLNRTYIGLMPLEMLSVDLKKLGL